MTCLLCLFLLSLIFCGWIITSGILITIGNGAYEVHDLSSEALEYYYGFGIFGVLIATVVAVALLLFCTWMAVRWWRR